MWLRIDGLHAPHLSACDRYYGRGIYREIQANKTVMRLPITPASIRLRYPIRTNLVLGIGQPTRHGVLFLVFARAVKES